MTICRIFHKGQTFTSVPPSSWMTNIGVGSQCVPLRSRDTGVCPAIRTSGSVRSVSRRAAGTPGTDPYLRLSCYLLEKNSLL